MLTYYIMFLVLLVVTHLAFSVAFWEPNVTKWSVKHRAIWVVSTIVALMLAGGAVLALADYPQEPGMLAPVSSWTA
jgi:hypothetical protein